MRNPATSTKENLHLSLITFLFLTMISHTVYSQAELVLQKSTIAQGISNYNIPVPFNISVVNIGNAAATNILVEDQVPDGYVFNAADNDNANWTWDPVSRIASRTITNILNQNESATITLTLRPQPVADTMDWVNIAEIASAETPSGTPFLGDSNSTYGNGDPTEPDYGQVAVTVYDLALRKTLVTPQNSYNYGDDVVFSIMVYNQGNEPVQNVRIRDFKPEGYIFNAADNPGWGVTAFGNPFYRFLQVLQPMDSMEVMITLELSPMMADGQAWDNYAAIDSAYALDNTPLLDDADSVPGTNTQAENSVLPNSPDDDNIFGLGLAFGEDEDDHDPANLEVFDFALTKVKITAPESFSYRQTVNFSTIVYNQGNQEADTVWVVDYIPCGYIFNNIPENAGWTFDPNERIARRYIAPAPLPDQQTSVDIVLEVAPCYDDPQNHWVNFAEIERVVDTLGNVRDDIDSQADAIQDNDAGGVPFGPSDDQLDGDGVDDEDDHDPRSIQVVDFALKKTVFAPDTARYGELVVFSIKGYNQGNITFTEVVLKDSIPDGYTFDPNLPANAGWSSSPTSPQYTFTGDILPGDSIEIFISLTLLQTQGIECEWVNYTELVQLRDAGGDRDDDADSFSFFTTDAEYDVKPGDPDDDNIFALGPNSGQDQDDVDPAEPPIFDLALNKVAATAGPYAFDQLIEFQITLYNQGNIPANNITIIDYLPEGLSYLAGNQTDPWQTGPIPNSVVLTVVDTLFPYSDTTFSIFLELECVPGDISAWTNAAEIASADDDTGNSGYDLDSTPDTDPTNDIGGSQGTNEDNHIEDDGTDVNGDGITDEDDHDIEAINIVDLALKKTLAVSPPFTMGQLIPFEIEIFNQGNVPLDSVVIVDYIAAGLTFSMANNPDWVMNSGNAFYTYDQRLMPGDSATVTVQLTFAMPAVPTGSADYINFAEIAEAYDTLGVAVGFDDIDSNPGSDTPTERGVVVDSPQDNDILSKDLGGEEDDHDPAGIIVFDLSLEKNVVTPAPYAYGDVVTYEIILTNEGTVPAQNITIEDEIGCGLVLSNSPVNAGWTFDPVLSEASFTYVPMLMAGQSVIIPIELEVTQCNEPFTPMTYNNVAEITSADDENDNPGDDTDSTPDNDDPDEDDQDDEPLEIVDLALTKMTVTSPQGVQDGDLVTFVFTVYNQGNDTVVNVVIGDYIPDGFTFDAAANQGWSLSGTTASYTIADLFPQEDTSVNIQLTFAPQNGLNLNNYGEILSVEDDEGGDLTGSDADSTPGNESDPNNQEEPGSPGDDNITTNGDMGFEDDGDPAFFGNFDLSIDKSLGNLAPGYKYGDVIPFEITVTNEGTLPAINTEITDRIPCGFVFDASLNTGWSYNQITSEATTVLTGPIVSGQSEMVTINLILQYCDMDEAYTNEVEITDDNTPDDMDPMDDDSTPDNNDPDEDDQDRDTLMVVDLAVLVFNVPTGPIALGGDVIFEVIVYNQGNKPIMEVELNQYFGAGYTLNDPNWTSTPFGATTTLTQMIPPGQSISTQIILSVNAAGTLQDYYTFSEIAEAVDLGDVPVAGMDVDSEPASNTATEQSVVPGSPDDDNITGRGPTFGEDEDDHDVAAIDPTGSIGDFVWKDMDYDGVQDAGEPGVAGVVVMLQTCTGQTIATTTTMANGSYIFDNVFPGDYRLVFDISSQNGCIFTIQNATVENLDSDADENGFTDCFTVNPGEEITTVDAGLAGLSDIGDFVFEDLDGDGIQDFNEPGIPNVVVNLYDGLGNLVNTTTTNGSGFYLFEDNFVGDYYLEFLPGSAYEATVPFTGNNNNDSNVDGSNGPGTTPTFTLIAANDDNTQDAGFFRCVTICGFSWYDIDEDDIRDDIENGINGLEVNFYRQNGAVYELVATTYTDEDPATPSGDGYFEVCVRPGRYYIEVPLPPYGLVLAQPFRGGNPFRDSDLNGAFGPSTSPSFVLSSGQSNGCRLGAGFYPMAIAGQTVWFDEDLNGQRSATELPVSNVLVEAFDETNAKVGESYTDIQGRYEIDYLEKELHYFKFTPPAGYSFTYANQGNDETDSDVDHSNGPNTTSSIMMQPGVHNTFIDAGLAAGVLPVEWLYVRAEQVSDGHLISWATATEIHAESFELERSIQGKPWETLEVIKAKNLPTGAGYSALDEHVWLSGDYRYRIKQNDFDGALSYSETVQLQVNRGLGATVFPNPATDRSTLHVEVVDRSEVNYTIINGAGQQVLETQSLTVDSGSHFIPLAIEDLPRGVYHVQVEVGRQQFNIPLLLIQ